MSATHSTTAAPATGQEHLAERLAERAGRLGVTIHRVGSLDEVAALAATLGTDGGPAAFAPPAGSPWRVVIAPTFASAQPALAQRLVAHGLTLGEVQPDDPGGSFTGVALGISRATFAIAETGTLVLTDQLLDRLVRMLVPKHLVVVLLDAIVPSLSEAGNRLRDLSLADDDLRYASFITGPSRTADIEMSLTVGAHGPAEVHIAILDEATA